MKYEVKKEFILTANEGEMEMLAKAVRDQITEIAKETAENGELILSHNPAQEFIEVTASSWFDLFEDLCKAVDTGNLRKEYDMTKEVVYYTFWEADEQHKKDREKLAEEAAKALNAVPCPILNPHTK
tara:strand:+ start:115 stop:495 length:381 start_codon:yes stop_codon:yes gene_type:complete